MIDYAQRPRQREQLGIGQIILIAFMGIAMTWALARGIDLHFQNQDRMLCQSAKVSGNAEYLTKCQCYYDGAPISCMQTYDRN